MDIGLICDSCDALNALEARACDACGQPLKTPLESDTQQAQTEEEQASSMIKCPKCNVELPKSFRFCGNCGAKMEAEEAPEEGGNARTIFFGAMQTPNRAKLILIKGEGLDGISYHLNSTEHVAGREEGAILFPDDPILSPRHACFYYEENKLMVRDEGSVNGVFVRLTTPLTLNPGSRFLVGEQLMQFEPCNTSEELNQADKDGTYFYSSPHRPCSFKLIQILRGGDIGMIYRAAGDEVTMGREENDINFPDDPYISGRHAAVKAEGEDYFLKDSGSKNGTFYLLEQPQPLEHGDYVFLGQQLLRVEIS